MNNLDPEVAENPQELVVYGGIGRAARNWECFDAIVAALARARRRRIAADPVGQAGRRVQDARRRAARADRQLEPRAEVGDVGALQRARPQGPHDVRPDDGRLVDLHRQPGHRAGHLRDVRRGRPPALRRRARRQVDPDRGPGRHGRRAAAGGDDGGRVDARDRMPAEPRSRCASRRATSTGRRATSTKRSRCSRDACAARQPVSVGLARQRGRDPARARAPRRAARHGDRPDVGARPRLRLSAGRLDASSAGARRRPIRRSTRRSSPRRSNRSSRTSRRCSRSTRRASRRSTTATTSGRSRIDEGVADAFAFPGFVPAYIRPLFCEGKGPFRWVALSGDPEDIYKTDRKVTELFPDNAHLHRWLDMAQRAHRVPGPARAHLLAGSGRAASRRPRVQRDGEDAAS